MKRVAQTRENHPGVLSRRPAIDRPLAETTVPLPVDEVDQLRELVDLVDRGLLSREEFERQRRKVTRD